MSDPNFDPELDKDMGIAPWVGWCALFLVSAWLIAMVGYIFYLVYKGDC